MTPHIINGKAIAARVESSCRDTIAAFNLKPKLAIITTDRADDASKVYMRNKYRAADRVGILVETYSCNSEDNMLLLISRLNEDPTFHGIIVQLPLPPNYNVKTIQESIAPQKDVDGFTEASPFAPCTPAGIIAALLDDEKMTLDGKHAVVIGRSEIVGKPLARLLIQENATVSLCHSHTNTELLTTLCRNADYIFCAAGVPGLVRPEMLKYGTVIIDISINRDIEGKLCGDAHPDCYPLCSAYTPVPGGVGPLTVSRLLWHTVAAALTAERNEI